MEKSDFEQFALDLNMRAKGVYDLFVKYPELKLFSKRYAYTLEFSHRETRDDEFNKPSFYIVVRRERKQLGKYGLLVKKGLATLYDDGRVHYL